MFKNNYLLFFLLILLACDNGVERSKNPGIIKVLLQPDPADTTITILNRVYHVDSTSVFNVSVAQGKVYVDSFYSELYHNIDDYRDVQNTYNILEQENGVYKTIKLFEYYAPVNVYQKIQFSFTGKVVKIAGFTIPVELPEGESVLVTFNHDFEVKENMTTEITISIQPLKSVVRFKDSYLFKRKMEITDVKYY